MYAEQKGDCYQWLRLVQMCNHKLLCTLGQNTFDHPAGENVYNNLFYQRVWCLDEPADLFALM